MAQALEGLRVLDLTQGPAGGIATMVLADFGADVLCVRRPEPRDAPLDELPAAPMWLRGKQTLEFDLDRGDHQELMRQLVAGADVLMTTWRPNALVRRGLDFQTLHQAYPHLVYCHITGFGSDGPLAELPGYEAVVAAYAGRMQSFSGLVDRTGPVFSAVQVATHACAQSAVAGTLAALLARGEAGPGRLVETSLLQGLLPYEMGPMLGWQLKQHFPDLLAALGAPSQEPPLPTLYYHPAQTCDGRWMQFGNLLPHLFDNFLIATDLMDVVTDPDFNPKQLLIADSAKHEAFRERMLDRIQASSASEWTEQLLSDGGIVGGVYQTTQASMLDPDVIDNGHVIEPPEGGLQLGPLAKLARTPADPGHWASQCPAAKGDTLAAIWRSDPRPQPSVPASSDLPLAGVKVVEIATIIAAPIGASFLADMGADVVKVEQIGGDPFRGMLSGLGAARVNGGKRSVSVNLKTERGRELVMTLVRDADVVIHNYRPGVPERLGFGYDQVAAVNPRVVYLQSTGYGANGPSAARPSTHPVPGALMGGAVHQMGGALPSDKLDFQGQRLWASRIMRANELSPDPNTGVVVASAVMLGLSERQRSGQGQTISVDMLGANAYANSDDFLSYPGKSDRALPDAGLHGLAANYRLYPCAESQWIFVALVTVKQAVRFRDTLLQANHRPPSLERLQANDEALARALTTLFANRTADYWQSLLVPADVACVRADGLPPNRFWLEDAQPLAMGLTTQVDHDRWGQFRRHGALVRFDGEQPALKGPPLAGQHNRDIFLEKGYALAEIEQMLGEGVLFQEAP